MWYCLILLFSGSMDRSHLGDHQKIYIFQNFQKLTKLWSVKLSLGWGSRSGVSFLEITSRYLPSWPISLCYEQMVST